MSRVGRWVRITAGIGGHGPREARLRRTVAGRVVLITGASEGIGAATARRLGRAGATVLLVARTAERLRAVREGIVAAGGEAHVHAADLSRPAEAEALGEELLRRYGRVDVIVSNAGRSIRRSVAETADRFHDVQRTIDLNYLGPVQLLLVLLPAMRAAGGGHIVNISTAGLGTPAQNWSSYLASKAAFDTWLRCAAPELRRYGVRVSTVYCGLVRTRMSAPTLHYRRLPAMNPDEAAAIVCRAVAHGRRTLQPWWSRTGELIAAAGKGPVESLMASQIRLAEAVEPLSVLGGVGLWRADRLIRLAMASRRYGSTLAAAVVAGPRDGIALVDRDGPISNADLTAAAHSLAAGLHHRLGVREGDRVAVCCGPHRGFAIATAGLGLLGADAVLLPPDLPADRLSEVMSREGITAVVHDGHVAAAVPASDWSALAGANRAPRPRRAGRITVLTSGTTGVPRSVQRRLQLRTLIGPVTTHLRLIPVRPGVPIVLAAPPHHGYGLAYLAAGLALGAPVILAADLDAEQTLAAMAEHRAGILVALPIQLSRICDVPGPVPAVSAIVTGAAPLSPALSERLRDRFGDKVFNLYGATEAGWAAIATPDDLRALPGTVGRAPRGVRLRILDPAGRPLPPGEIGEVHVDGWQADGSSVATGDLGRLDRVGRLLLCGRVDDMIVSGGENVYPAPVEAALTGHPAVADAVVEAVPDDEFGQRLRAWVLPRAGGSLSEAELREWLRGRLSRAEQPRDIRVVTDLPRTATGKPVPPA